MLKVFELCLSSPTVSKFFTLLFLPISTVSEPFRRWGGAFHTLEVPLTVRFRRLIRFWTVRYPGVPYLKDHAVVPGMLHCACACRGCCTQCYVLYVLYVLCCASCVCCAVLVCACAYVVVYQCVFCFSVSILVIFLALTSNDPPFY